MTDRSMRILLVSACFPPQDNIASLRSEAFARYWSEAGEQVTVLTTSKGDDQADYARSDKGYEVVEVSYDVPRLYRALRRRDLDAQERITNNAGSSSGVAQRRGALGRLKDRSGVFSAVRMPDLTDYWVKPAIGWCRDKQPWDVVVSSSGPYTAHLIGLEMKRLGLSRFWVTDFRDLWVNNHLYRGLFPFTLRERRLQQRCLTCADLATTVSDELAQTLRSQTQADVQVVYNGFEPNELDGLPQQEMFPDDGIVRLVYTGTLYRDGQDPTPLLQALRLLKQGKPDVAVRLRVVIVGRGYEVWAGLAEQYDVAEFVEAADAVDRADALRMQRDADALVLVDWNDPAAGVLTGKLFEYLALDAPILVVGGQEDSAIARMVQQSRRGLHLGTDQQRIAETLTNLLTEPTKLSMGPDRDFLATLTRQAQSLRLLEMVRRRDTAPVPV